MLRSSLALLKGTQTPALQFGVMGGVSIANFVGDDVEDADSRSVPFFGGTLVVQPAGSALGFETGFLYMPKGASTDFEEVAGEGDGISFEIDCDEFEEETKGIDYGVTGGLAVDIPVGARAVLTPTPVIRAA